MRLLDTNILIYAADADSAHHREIKSWLDALFICGEQVAMPWESLLGYARVLTNPRIFPSPVRLSEVWTQIESWTAMPNVWIPQATERHAKILGELLAQPGLGHRHIHEAHLAALAIEHGLILCSTDMDFGRFPHLRWENPLLPTHRAREPRVAYRTRKPRTRK